MFQEYISITLITVVIGVQTEQTVYRTANFMYIFNELHVYTKERLNGSNLLVCYAHQIWSA